MTEQELRALDGPGLTAEAFRMGLAPPEVYPVVTPFHELMFARNQWRGREVAIPWSPLTEIAEAYECHRMLRHRGFYTSITWETMGTVQVFHENTMKTEVQVWQEDYQTDVEECQALLLCAVLAASALERMHETGGNA